MPHKSVNPEFQVSVCDRLRKSKVKSNSRMAPRTRKNLTDLEHRLQCWNSPHRAKALDFLEEVGSKGVYEILHSMRRWYTGQTMAGLLSSHQKTLSKVMALESKDVQGIYRGFKVPVENPLASVKEGAEISLPVERNRGLSAWSTKREVTNRFSGGGKGKVGLIVQLVDGKDVTPLLAPPAKTEPWFNAMYEHVIGKSFRPTEGEYLLKAPKLRVKVLKVKR